MDEFVYMVIEREFIKCAESVYKIGRTKDVKHRLQRYPKGTELLLLSTVSDSIFVENQIKKTFKEKFKQRTDIGTEYFEGTCVEMLNEFNEIVKSAQLQPTQAPILPPEPGKLTFPVPSHVTADVMSMMLKQQETTLQQNSDLIHQNTALVNMHKMHTCECGYEGSTKYK